MTVLALAGAAGIGSAGTSSAVLREAGDSLSLVPSGVPLTSDRCVVDAGIVDVGDCEPTPESTATHERADRSARRQARTSPTPTPTAEAPESPSTSSGAASSAPAPGPAPAPAQAGQAAPSEASAPPEAAAPSTPPEPTPAPSPSPSGATASPAAPAAPAASPAAPAPPSADAAAQESMSQQGRALGDSFLRDPAEVTVTAEQEEPVLGSWVDVAIAAGAVALVGGVAATWWGLRRRAL